MLSVIIPTRHRPQSLTKLVQSLQQQTLAKNNFEILVVYNDFLEAQNSPLLSQHDDSLKILFAEKPGVNWARNKGIQQASGDVLLFIDDDCLVMDDHFLLKHQNYHQQYPELIALGGPYINGKPCGFWDQMYQLNIDLWLKENQRQKQRSMVLLGGNSSYKSHVFKNGFSFNSEITYGGSETPLNTLLATHFGPHGFFEDLAIVHNSNIHFFNFIKKAYLQGAGAALQEKLYGHQLKKESTNKLQQTWVKSCALLFYGWIFKLGYKKNLAMNSPLMIVIITQIIAVFAKFYMFLLQKFYFFFQTVYGFFSAMISPLTGFLASLAEKPQNYENLSFMQKILARVHLFFRKWAWLGLKTLGLR